MMIRCDIYAPSAGTGADRTGSCNCIKSDTWSGQARRG